MFANTPKFTGEITNWDVSKVENMAEMFFNAKSLDDSYGSFSSQMLKSWDLKSLKFANNMFTNAADLQFDYNLCQKFEEKLGVKSDNLGCVFTPIDNANIHDAVKLWRTDHKTAMKTYGNISNWDVSNVSDMSYLFSCDQHNQTNCAINGDISNWNTAKLNSTFCMFMNQQHFNQTLSAWNLDALAKSSNDYAAYQTFAGAKGDTVSEWCKKFEKELKGSVQLKNHTHTQQEKWLGCSK